MYGKGLVKGLGITLKHLFEKDISIQYPEQRPFLQDRFRGCLTFDFPKCIACRACIRACPNNVLSLETDPNEKGKKRKLLSYTIDLQYCLYCNLCVEACPVSCLAFSHHFELAQYQRDAIKIVHTRPPEMDLEKAEAEESGERQEKGEDKKQKQVEAMHLALQKNPQKILDKLLENETQAEILAQILMKDEKIITRLAEMMIEDREKAKKVARALVNKELKNRASAEGKEDNTHGS